MLCLHQVRGGDEIDDDQDCSILPSAFRRARLSLLTVIVFIVADGRHNGALSLCRDHVNLKGALSVESSPRHIPTLHQAKRAQLSTSSVTINKRKASFCPPLYPPLPLVQPHTCSDSTVDKHRWCRTMSSCVHRHGERDRRMMLLATTEARSPPGIELHLQNQCSDADQLRVAMIVPFPVISTAR